MECFRSALLVEGNWLSDVGVSDVNVCVCVCSNCQKGLSKDAVCHGHQSSMSVRKEGERERETERRWRPPHLTPA